MRVYIAGPMTGIPQFNFRAFDAAARELTEAGYDPLNPAAMDDPASRRAALASRDGSIKGGINGKTWGDYLSRAPKIIADEADAVAVLPGWEISRGARLEVYAAELCEKPVYDFAEWSGTGDPLQTFPVAPGQRNVLEEANSITQGVRADNYGSAAENAVQFAEIAAGATGLDIKPEHYPVLMICVKLARIQGGASFHRDSWVDIAGYARVAEMIQEG